METKGGKEKKNNSDDLRWALHVHIPHRPTLGNQQKTENWGRLVCGPLPRMYGVITETDICYKGTHK